MRSEVGKLFKFFFFVDIIIHCCCWRNIGVSCEFLDDISDDLNVLRSSSGQFKSVQTNFFEIRPISMWWRGF